MKTMILRNFYVKRVYFKNALFGLLPRYFVICIAIYRKAIFINVNQFREISEEKTVRVLLLQKFHTVQ